LYAHLAHSSVVETIFTRSAPAVGDPYQYSRKMLGSALVGETVQLILTTLESAVT
jgi:hypothetical protein